MFISQQVSSVYCEGLQWIMTSTELLLLNLPEPQLFSSTERSNTARHLRWCIDSICDKAKIVSRQFFVGGVLDEDKYADFRKSRIRQLHDATQFLRWRCEPEYWRLLLADLPSSADLFRKCL